jgi:N-acetylated-alpha-linked acidic dipeptidase
MGVRGKTMRQSSGKIARFLKAGFIAPAAAGLALVFLHLALTGSPPKKPEARMLSNDDTAIRDYLRRIDGILSAERMVEHLKHFTAEPHVASSPRNNDLAQYVLDEWKSYGLENVHRTQYDVLLSFPESIRVEIISPKKTALALKEDGIPKDPSTLRADVGIPYNAYSISGEVTAPVVYANSGNPQDYDLLEKRGLDLKGKIALVRYSEPYSYRGFKAQTAQERGLAALLIYSDPKEDGYARGPVFPDGPWGPLSHIQRGGIPFDFIYPGDPLTPGWASTPGAKRIAPEESLTLPKIISVPISARDARPILEMMGGPAAPEEWKGALPLAYRFGGASPLVHIDVKMDNSTRTITDVVGCVQGSEEPDEIVLVGNHRDAWVFGGFDPSSGTACLMDLARAFGEAKKAGLRPKRSVYFASWDAEEFTLTGSTEWGEENRDRLVKNLVAYLNVDSSAAGRNFTVSAVPCLSRVVVDALRDVPDPATGKPVYECWKAGPKERGTIVTAGGSGRINPIGSGSDHTVFLNHICAPALDMSFAGDYGVYHSMYDDFYWMSHFGDPGMRYTRALAMIWARITVDLASSRIIPLDYENYAAELKGYLDEWAKQFDPSKQRSAKLSGLVEEMRRAAEAVGPALFGGRGASRMAAEKDEGAAARVLPPEKRREIDGLLIDVERCFAFESGIPDRNWFRHLVFGTRSTYAALLLPELTEAAEAGNADGVAAALAHLEEAVTRATAKLREIAAALAQSGA